MRYGMQAVADKVNRAGGVCGRKLELKLVDDGWDYTRGGDFIRNLVQNDKVFALAVVPSSEGLLNVSKEGYLQAQKVPVVGSDGMLINQYTDPYIWPVAASTVSTMHIMAKQAFDAGVTRFGIVYETTYHFGIEGAYAFNAAVKRLTGSDIEGYSDPFKSPKCEKLFCGIPAASQYNSELNTFTGACKPLTDPTHCQFVALLLEPTTALNWMRNGSTKVKPTPDQNFNVAGPQPLFTYDFAKSCGDICDQMMLWTGFFPPLGDYLTRPPVATFVEDVKAASRSADYNNTFVQGGYLGMQLLVHALRQVGPNLTRESLRAVLDTTDFDFGLSASLKWRKGNHFANTRMRAFSIQYKSGAIGWRDMQIELEDPWVGQDGGH
ncbi:MAG: ABC transporter substrate-binding protein [Actinomycetota bacterium]|nr:ABC transporter substrate-binding protein [Actinomycetota bacterium]